MQTSTGFFRRASLACGLAAGAVIAAGSALAATITNEGPIPTDPIMELAEQMQAPNQFTLNSAADVDLVKFHQPHMVSVCAPQLNSDNVNAASHAVGIVVSWDGEHETVAPGNCFTMDAQRVAVRPAGPLGSNTILTGTIKVLR